ncbi:hypothetical protein LUZ60_004548 [Juncus effusus]|nr:hypothetical protein LUZ60_004548 [Juncus effusus]
MAGGSDFDDEWELTSSNDAITVVLVGKLGYGKSATGNSILGRKAFVSKSCPVGVTTTSELQSTVLKDGRTVNVIDTPGLFDWSNNSEDIGKEIVNCVNLAKDGIHAVLMVFSIRARFSEEEEATIERLQMFFGERIIDYMVVVFTGGDELEESDMTFNEYLSQAPKPLQSIIQMCKNRVVLFNNRTKDATEKSVQVQQLLYYVDSVMANHGGKPFSDEIFLELKKGAVKLQDKEKAVEALQGYSAQEIAELKKEIYRSYDDQLARITKMVEEKLNSTIERLEKELAEEQAARLKAQKVMEDARLKSDDEIRKLRESLEKAQRETEEFKRLAQNGRCAIL